MTSVSAMMARAAKAPFEPAKITLPELGVSDVEIAVESCGLCHSDYSMWANEWGRTSFPFVAGHEVIGRVAAKGSAVRHLKEGDRVGLGWFSSSCMYCRQCLGGSHNLCASNEETLVGRHGGFAERVTCSAEWAAPLPDGVSAADAGPLFCGGITVFQPMIEADLSPRDAVAVVGIGGLGHMAISFLHAWGCEVTAFTSSAGKADDARKMGAHHVLDSRDTKAMAAAQGKFKLILVTVNVALDWNAYLGLLGPRGRLHFVGAVLEPLSLPAFGLIGGAKSVAGSPLGSPAVVQDMLEFCARHHLSPITEHMPMTRINDAFQHLEDGKARYRIVLDNDLR
jgi:alcohol/geraniol dehydrogenase (NADP+)